MNRKSVSSIAFLTFMVTLLPYSVHGQTTGTLFITGDTVLTDDHFGNIIVAADGVTLDCNQHNIIGSGTFAGHRTGVGLLMEERSGVTIKNCLVTGFGVGFMLLLSRANTLESNTAHDNDEGFSMFRSSDNRLEGNTANNNLLTNGALGGGFFVGAGPAGNNFIGNTVTDNGQFGFWSDGSGGKSDNTFSSNTVSGHIVGFEIGGGIRNSFLGNTVSSNVVGFDIFGFDGGASPQDNSFVGNIVTSNTYGFAVVSDGHVMADNTVTFNSFGFVVFGVGNTITRNLIVENSVGISLCASVAGMNTFAPNTFLIVRRLPPPGGVILLTNDVNVVSDGSC